jgi:hypothetical protein
LALPVLGQQKGPESLLPPGFGDPPPPPTPAIKGPPAKSAASPPAQTPTATPSAQATDAAAPPKPDEQTESDAEAEVRYDVPPTARRSLRQIGIMSEAGGGFAASAFGNVRGTFLMSAARNTKGPLASRWGAIMTRRLLASRTNTPADVSGADWVAERAALILRIGDANVARQLIQQVDAGAYSPRLLEVAMPVFLANADLSGMCPVADAGAQRTDSPEWKTALSICASLGGEQGRATSLLNQVRNRGWMKGTDYLLTEKAVGAGVNGRRTVKIEWDKVDRMTLWRHGMAQATGLEPPEALYSKFGAAADGWRSQLPMVSIKTRVSTANGAAAMGVLSNRELVDIYGLAADDPDFGESVSAKTEALRTAFVGNGDSARVGAMQILWSSATDERQRHAMLVLTARAAAMVAPTSDNASSADQLVAAMLAAGFDTQAARWRTIVDEGSLAWALLATGSPDWPNMIGSGPLDDFSGNDNSTDYHKSALLVAGLAGLGRVTPDTLSSFSGDIKANVTRQTKWAQAIEAAAARGESGTVVLLSAAGLQASDWTKIPAHHLFHIVKALRAVGLDSEARMIAAEAVSFG